MADEKTYRIGEVAEMLNLKAHVLRFWETEFPQLAPLRTESGQRLYRDEDVATLRRIRQLLHEQGMTIDGARRVLETGNLSNEDIAREQTFTAQPDSAFLLELENELSSIRNILSQP